jgi:DNA-binding Xre family transcriptional regulator
MPSATGNEDYGACAVFVNGDFPDKKRVPAKKALSLPLKQLGDNIRRERMAKKITQQQLAELADLNIRNVQRIEAGESDVLFSTLARIKKSLGCPWDILMPKSWS